MKTPYWLLAILSIVLAATAQAQVMMQVSTDRDNYLPYESIRMQVTLRNNSGNHLTFGSGEDAPGFIRLEILDRSGNRVKPTVPDFNAADGLVLPAGASKSVIINVNEFYALNKPGYYELTARLRHPRFSYDLVSQVLRIKINEGQVVWERHIGIPSSGPGEAIQERQIAILSFQADQSRIYALRVQDKRYVYNVARLAPNVRGVKPSFEVDARSHLHFLVQTQPRLFSYWVYDYNGKEKVSAHYVVEEYLPIPRLIRDPDIGRVMVAGGRRAQEGIDFNEETLPVMEAQELPPPKVVKQTPTSSLAQEED